MSYNTWPPTMGHRIVVVETTDGIVRVTVGRVIGYACGERADGELRSLSLRRADGSCVTHEGVAEVFDLDAAYSYGTAEAAVAAARDALADLARALLSPVAVAPVDEEPF